jgi:hypothetical protein
VKNDELNLGPSVRLVANANQGCEEAKAQALGPGSPSVRLAYFDIPAVNESVVAAPTVRLAHKDAQGNGILTGQGYGGVDMTDKKLTAAEAPALLVSYVYVEPFLANRSAYCYRDWVMDSGAFSAHNAGTKIDLNQYIDACLELLANDPTLTEVFALDVIGNAEASLKNTEEMVRQGVPAIPTFHIGEPEEMLIHIAKNYPKIALGGVAMERGDLKFSFCEQCFARVWPKKIHGFGMSTEQLIYGLPFHSVDATNWEIGPCAFGNWQKFGKMSVRGSNQDLRSQVKHYLSIEAKARVRWRKEMELLEKLSPTVRPVVSPSVRLALEGGAAGGERSRAALSNRVPLPKTVKPPPKDITKVELDDKWKKNWWE